MRGHLNRIGILGNSFTVLVAPCAAFFVIEDMRLIFLIVILNQIHYPNETQRLALQLHATQPRTSRKIELCGIFNMAGFVHVAMNMRTFSRIRALLKDILHPLVVEKARAVDEVMKPPNR